MQRRMRMDEEVSRREGRYTEQNVNLEGWGKETDFGHIREDVRIILKPISYWDGMLRRGSVFNWLKTGISQKERDFLII